MSASAMQGSHNNLSPDLVTAYNLRPGNRAGLFSKEKVIKHVVYIYSTEINKRSKCTLCPGAHMGDWAPLMFQKIIN